MEVRISETHFPLETLGPGRRLGVWFQGCSLACAGCMSRHTWAARGGTSRHVDELLELWREALDGGAEGLTVSGGEPLQQPDALAELLAGAVGLRNARTGRGPEGGRAPADLLVYTGYEPAEWTERQERALAGADAVVTGRFRVAEPTRLVWRGSANQRIRPRTALGAVRYAPHLEREATGARLQAVVTPGAGAGRGMGLRLYGVPLRGELARAERALRGTGVSLRDASWRP
ncbi:4Fe-4S single cluster domain-containing protein [Streptomyces sp. A144]|uniref:4Fe-4S single cluster domain-containing protein n=1 Tax=Streptomyces sp. A144 TaxID=2871487 RepID=UPI001CBA908F|nr:4Fe-4S single cluster domain-containing protein [Streptomyces sp. A144]UAX56545.1 radical SAM protein [Streptomyces sp. A144]